MMSRSESSRGSGQPIRSRGRRATALSEEDRSKDAFFVQVAEVAEAMIARHGKDFAMGTLVLSARFIAEGKPLIKRNGGATTTMRQARIEMKSDILHQSTFTELKVRCAGTNLRECDQKKQALRLLLI